MKNKLKIYLLLPFMFLCACSKEVKHTSENAVNVIVSHPETRVFRDVLKVNANVEAKHHAAICARVSGTIDFLKVDEGDHVKKGERLFQIDKENLQSNLDIAKHTLNVAEAMMKTKESDYKIELLRYRKKEQDLDRAKRLVRGGQNLITMDEYEDAELAYKAAITSIGKARYTLEYSKAMIERLKGEIRIAEKKLADSDVKAPYDGVVTTTIKKAGEYVKEGAVVLEMENPDIVEISSYLSSSYYSRIKAGKTLVEIYSNEGVKIEEMPITYKSPKIDSDSRTFEIKILINTSDKLVSGMLCKLNIILSEQKGLGLPEDAVLMRSGNKFIVFTVNKDLAEELEVKAGITYNGYAEILSGVTEKTQIVIEGQAFLNDGAKVKIVNNSEKEADNVSK